MKSTVLIRAKCQKNEMVPQVDPISKTFAVK